MKSEEQRRCEVVWLQTLASFGMHRKLLASEELEIARAIQKHGAEGVELALYGARFEPKSERFDPAGYVQIGRVLTRDRYGQERIDRFVNLGARARSEEAARKTRHEEIQGVRERMSVSPLDAIQEEPGEQNPERVRSIINGMFGKQGGQ